VESVSEQSNENSLAYGKTIIKSIFASIFTILVFYLMYFLKIEIIIYMGFVIAITLAIQFFIGLIGLFIQGARKKGFVAMGSAPIFFLLVFDSPLTISLRQ